MTFSTLIIGLLVISLTHIILSEWYLKRILNIKAVRKSILSDKRKKKYVITEFILIILFIARTFYIIENLDTFSPIPMFVFLFLLNLFRGMEEWKENKREKTYYHEWLGCVTILVMFLFVLIRESS